MRQTLSILCLAILFLSCNSNKKNNDQEPVGSKDKTVPMADSNGIAKTDTAGSTSLDRIGDLWLGMTGDIVTGKLGKPEKIANEKKWEADGLFHLDWEYKTKGITLHMTRENNVEQVFGITIVPPSDLKTPKNIGLGAAYTSVVSAYEKDIDKEMTDSDHYAVVVGSVYGGLIFNFENEKVVRIFVGAAAE